MKKFMVCPGHIKSKNDGDWHYIGAFQLMRLYGVNPKDCVVAERDHPGRSWASVPRANATNLIRLAPRYNGDYREYLEQALAEWRSTDVKNSRDE